MNIYSKLSDWQKRGLITAEQQQKITDYENNVRRPMLLAGMQYEGVNAPLLQNVHPPSPIFPSRLGHVNPASTEIFCTRPPNVRRKYPE